MLGSDDDGGGVWASGASFWVTNEAGGGDKELGALQPPVGDRVQVRCDRIARAGWNVQRDDAKVVRVALCEIGKHVLPLVFEPDDEPDRLTFMGTLVDLPPSSVPWVAAIHRDPPSMRRCTTSTCNPSPISTVAQSS
jgi:hypothetical protein